MCQVGCGRYHVVSCCGTVRVAWQQHRVAVRASAVDEPDAEGSTEPPRGTLPRPPHSFLYPDCLRTLYSRAARSLMRHTATEANAHFATLNLHFARVKWTCVNLCTDMRYISVLENSIMVFYNFCRYRQWLWCLWAVRQSATRGCPARARVCVLKLSKFEIVYFKVWLDYWRRFADESVLCALFSQHTTGRGAGSPECGLRPAARCRRWTRRA